ncbi:unknown similar to AMEV223 [Choristoneura rosaceana entomopoxvirus 'L']|uniref:Uncharacterized protein n=1 Tax=Choristoneura rosaceana entomopoxvirus 'L' TaxID=1293539 RepID=A0ABM9QKS8_9POXV|nr:unknown similar to AMEV223 [Choristoneura rosaceana entomopoxvirus 'L']CCU56126.1 unknown similar to AMEV223 [Choristoneura rosaceana entomopoxvirus 'L']
MSNIFNMENTNNILKISYLNIIIHIISNIIIKYTLILNIYYYANIIIIISNYIFIITIIIDDICTILHFIIIKQNLYIYFKYINYQLLLIIIPFILTFFSNNDMVLYNFIFMYILSLIYFIFISDINYSKLENFNTKNNSNIIDL